MISEGFPGHIIKSLSHPFDELNICLSRSQDSTLNPAATQEWGILSVPCGTEAAETVQWCRNPTGADLSGQKEDEVAEHAGRGPRVRLCSSTEIPPKREGLRISSISSAAVCCSSGKWHHCTTSTTGSVGVSSPDSLPTEKGRSSQLRGTCRWQIPLSGSSGSALTELKYKPAPQITQIVTENEQHSSGCVFCAPKAGSLCPETRLCPFIQPGMTPGAGP